MDTNDNSKTFKILLVLFVVIILLLLVFSGANKSENSTNLDSNKFTFYKLEKDLSLFLVDLLLFSTVAGFLFQLLSRNLNKLLMVQWLIPIFFIFFLKNFGLISTSTRSTMILVLIVSSMIFTLLGGNEEGFTLDMSLFIVMSGIYCVNTIKTTGMDITALTSSLAFLSSFVIFVVSIVIEFFEDVLALLFVVALAATFSILMPATKLIILLLSIGSLFAVITVNRNKNGEHNLKHELYWDFYTVFNYAVVFTLLYLHGNPMVLAT